MQIATIHDLKHLLPANRCFVSGQNFLSDDLRPIVTGSPDHECLYGIYLTKPADAGYAVWAAAINARSQDLEYHPPKAKDDLVGHMDLRTKATEEDWLMERAYLYFFDPLPPDLSVVDISQWSPLGKLKALNSLRFKLCEVERAGSLVQVFALNHKRPLVIHVNEWQYVVVNRPMQPVAVAELMPPVIAELRKRMNILRPQPFEQLIPTASATSPLPPADC
ncbi:MAG: hypothetical protein WC750_02410 [Patescibacteria group bacterium]|jgi:hypothetical protein